MKSKKDDIVNKVYPMAQKACDNNSVMLYDVDFYKEGADYTLCVLIDKPGGVFIEDCENVSRELDPMLDEADPIDCRYCLEVSSCGADRKLTKPAHYLGAIGEKIKIGFYSPIDGSKSAYGILEKFEDGCLTVDADGTKKQYKLSDISSARVDVDYSEILANNN